MKTFSLLVFFFSSLFYNLIFAQGGLLTYQTVAIPVGATEFPVFLDLNVPDPPEGPADFFVQLTLQIIDKDLADDFSAVGENILTYPLSLTSGPPVTLKETISLPNGMIFQENLPDNKIYRFVNLNNQDSFLFDSNTNEFRGIVAVANNPVDDSPLINVGGSSQFSNIDIVFTDRSTVVVPTNDFIIKTNMKANFPDPQFDFASVKLQIHIVDENNVFNMEDVTPQDLISETAFINIPNGNSNIDFTLTAPSILSKDLPSGKVYRVRLVNNIFNTQSAFPFPHQLFVVTNPTLSNADFSKKETFSFYPNPAQDIITINSATTTDTYKIFNMSGQTVNEVTSSGKISIAHLTSGTYFLANKKGIVKFVKK